MITVSDVLAAVPSECEIVVVDPAGLDHEVSGPATLDGATESSLVYVKHAGEKGLSATRDLAVAVAVVSRSLQLEPGSVDAVLIVRADNPRLAFIKLVGTLFVVQPEPVIHPSAVISPNAVVADSVSLGAGCTLGACEIGEGSVLHPGVHIYDGVLVGAGVTIHAGAVVGSDGFGYERDASGVPIKFPHLGRVVVEDGVEIGANAVVDRGTLGDTVIESQAKIDNLVHIAHNVRVGRGSLIAAGAVVAGSTIVGERTWVGPLACISNGLTIGDDAEISLGAVVTRDVPAGTRVTGNFAVEHRAFLRHQRSLD